MTTLQSLQKAKEGIASEKRKTVAPTLLARAYAQRAGDREPLHLRMRLAILDALAQGAWSAGDKLPPLIMAFMPGELDPVGETKLIAPPRTVAPSRFAI